MYKVAQGHSFWYSHHRPLSSAGDIYPYQNVNIAEEKQRLYGNPVNPPNNSYTMTTMNEIFSELLFPNSLLFFSAFSIFAFEFFRFHI